MSQTRFGRRTVAAPLVLFGTALFGVVAGFAVAQTPPAQTPPAQTPPAQTPPAQTPPRASTGDPAVTKAIADAAALRDAERFADAVALLETWRDRFAAPARAGDRRRILLALADSHFYFGTSLLGRERFADARAQYEQAVAIDLVLRPADAAIGLSQVGFCEFQSRHWARAVAAYEQSTAIRRKLRDKKFLVSTLLNLASAREKLGQHVARARALTERQTLLPNDTERADNAAWLADAWLDAGQPEPARAAIALCRKLGGGEKFLRTRTARALVLDKKPVSAAAARPLAEALVKDKRFADALALAGLIRATTPAEVGARETLLADILFFQARAAKNERRFDDAIALLKRAIGHENGRRPTDLAYELNELGTTLVLMGRYSDAARAFERAAATVPKTQPELLRESLRGAAIARNVEQNWPALLLAGEKLAAVTEKQTDNPIESAALRRVGITFAGLAQNRMEHHADAVSTLSALEKIATPDTRDAADVALARLELGRAFLALGRFPEAQAALTKALTWSETAEDRAKTALILALLGQTRRRLGMFDDAVASLSRALLIARKPFPGSAEIEAIALRERALTAQQSGKSADALGFAIASVARAADASVTPPARARAEATLAGIEYDQGRSLAGQKRAEAAVALARKAVAQKLPDSRGALAEALCLLGETYSGTGSLDRMLPALKEARKLATQIGDNGILPKIIRDLGAERILRGSPNDAVVICLDALKISLATGDPNDEAYCRWYLSIAYRNLNQTDLVIEQVSLASKRVNDVYLNGELNFAVAGTLDLLGKFPEAQKAYSDAIEIFVLANHPGSEISARLNLAGMFQRQGKFDDVSRVLQPMIARFDAFDNESAISDLIVQLAALVDDMGKQGEADKYLRRVLPYFESIDDKTRTAQTLEKLASLSRRRGNLAAALDFLERAGKIRIATRDRAGQLSILIGRSRILAAQKNLAGAKLALEAARKIADELHERDAKTAIAGDLGDLFYDAREYRAAISEYQKALVGIRRSGAALGQGVILNNLMHAWGALGSKKMAAFYGKQAVNIYQQVRANQTEISSKYRDGFVDSVSATYRSLAEYLIDDGRIAEAQQVLGLLKQQEYLDFIRRDAGSGEVGGKADLSPAETDAAKSIADASADATAVAARYQALLEKKSRTPDEEKQLDALWKRLEAASAAFQKALDTIEQNLGDGPASAAKLATVRDAEALTGALKSLSDASGAPTAAVFTLVGESGIKLIVVTSGISVARDVPVPVAQLNQLVASFRSALQNPGIDPRPAGKKLFDLLLAPIENDLSGAKITTVLWSLDGALRYVPIAALSPDGKGYVLDTGRRHGVFTTATLSRLADAPVASWKALTLGVSKQHTVGGKSFAALPGVSGELDGVNAALGSSQSLLDEAFTEDALKVALRSRNPVVHIASHFDFRPGDERQSFLLLGDGGAFTMDRLRAAPPLFEGVDLLALSACDTASAGGSGAEVESFALLAQKKGARAVLASLWPVADASTQILMRAFYRIRQQHPELGKADALKNAQRALRTGAEKPVVDPNARSAQLAAPAGAGVKFVAPPDAPCAHPYYWAPFILIGNPR